MQPRIETLKEKKLIGYQLKMSLINNKTGQLWGQLGPRIKEVKNRVTEDKISMQIYDSSYHQKFNPENEFEKWATVEVEDFENIPTGMKSFILKEGLYAVFDYKGSSSDNSIFQYIFWNWLPSSPYQIDDRPHFEILGEKYKNNDPNSEEEIWIPIVEKKKAST
jgi:AraC family transcriptional regulator